MFKYKNTVLYDLPSVSLHKPTTDFALIIATSLTGLPLQCDYRMIRVSQ